MRRILFATGLLLALLAMLWAGSRPAAATYPPGTPPRLPAQDKGGDRSTTMTRPALTIPGSPLRVEVQATGTYGVWRNNVQQFFGGSAESVSLWINGELWGSGMPAPTNHYFTPVSQNLTGDG